MLVAVAVNSARPMAKPFEQLGPRHLADLLQHRLLPGFRLRTTNAKLASAVSGASIGKAAP
jgi:hypothetical protein